MTTSINLKNLVEQHKLELISTHAKLHELTKRSEELIVIIKSLELGAAREKELTEKE